MSAARVGRWLAAYRWGVASVLVLAVTGVGLWVLWPRGGDAVGDRVALATLSRAGRALEANPSATLPAAVKVAYAPAGTGQEALRGHLYLPARPGACAVAAVTVDRSWLASGDRSGFRVGDPVLRRACPAA